MAFFDRTSTPMLSMIAAVYGVFVYTISFSLEMWFIVTSPVTSSSSLSPSSSPSSSSILVPSSLRSSLYPGEQQAVSRDDRLDREQRLHLMQAESSGVSGDGSDSAAESDVVPVFAFVLAAVYFAIVMVSLLLILGIIIRSMMCVSAWLIAIVLLFFPEAALVFFITIYSWGVDSRNGQIELCFYVIRFILNIFFVICVQNLLSQWKTEKQASSFAFNLNAYNAYPPVTSSNSPYIEGCSTTVNPVFKFASIRGSQFDARTLNGTAFEAAESDAIDYLQQHEQEMMQKQEDQDHFNSSMTRRGMHQKQQPANSRGSSSSLNERYSTQSLDRHKLKPNTRPSCNSSPFQEEVILRPMSHRPFNYLHRPGSSADVRSEQDPYIVSQTAPDSSRLSYSQSFQHRPQIFSSKTLPRHFERISSIQSLRDVAL